MVARFFLGTTYQNYQMTIKYTKWSQNLKQAKWPQNIPTSSTARPSKIYPNRYFCTPSGNPVLDWQRSKNRLPCVTMQISGTSHPEERG
jgi:hypothetical protein